MHLRVAEAVHEWLLPILPIVRVVELSSVVHDLP